MSVPPPAPQIAPHAQNSGANPKSKDQSLILDHLKQIVELLQASTITEESGKDPLSRFWTAYKKFSGDYDSNMLERCNSSMDILLIFAGLFSAVNTAFIIAMRPNSGDTTNALLQQLIKITPNSSSVAQIPLTPTAVWPQVFAYASLALSLIAAFGAVLGKQWLGHYKTNRYDCGSLIDQCKQRHRKFLELSDKGFEDILQSFTVVLQISLFLFVLSLGGAMWTQQRTISIIIIVTAGCSALILCYAIVLSSASPDSPFQTFISLFIQRMRDTRLRMGDVHRRMRNALQSLEKDADSVTVSAMIWILDASTDPDVLRSVLDLMVTPSHNVLSMQLVEQVLDRFKSFHDSRTGNLKGNVQAYGRALLDLIHYHPKQLDGLQKLIAKWEKPEDLWIWWRKLYLPQALEQCQVLHRQMPDDADLMRDMLRIAAAACIDGFTSPEHSSHADAYIKLVWQDGFKSELGPNVDVDWLMACAEKFHATDDFEVAGYALFLLAVLKNASIPDLQRHITPFLNRIQHESLPILRHSTLRVAFQALDDSDTNSNFPLAVLTAIRSSGHTPITLLNYKSWPNDSSLVGSSLLDIQCLVLLVFPIPKLNEIEKYKSYFNGLAGFMHAVQHPTSKRAALRVACSAIKALAEDTTASDDVQNNIFSLISPALHKVVDANRIEAEHDFYYLSLIFTLAKRRNWLARLVRAKHIARCTSIIPEFHNQPPPYLFYLAGIFLRIRSISTDMIMPKKWWDLTRMAWHVAGCSYDQNSNRYASGVLDDGTEILEDLAERTAMCMLPEASGPELEFLRKGLNATINRLEERRTDESIQSAVKDLKDKVQQRMLERVA